MGSNTVSVTAPETFEADLFHGSAPERAVPASVMHHLSAANVHTVVGVAPAASDQMGTLR